MEKLLADLKAIDGKLDALLAHSTLTDEQRAEYDRLQGERTNCKASIDREKGRLDREEERTKLEAEAAARARTARQPVTSRLTSTDTPQTGKQHLDADGRVVGTIEETDEEINLRIGESSDAQRRQTYRQQRKASAQYLKASGYSPWGEFRNCADFVRSGLQGAGSQAFDERIRKHMAVQGMSEGIGADGGYAVMPEFSNRIIDRVYSNDLWSRTDNYTVTGNNMTFLANAETSRATGSRHGGLRGYWIGEGAAPTASKPTLREVSLKLVKLGVIVYLTDELIADSGLALQAYIERKASEEFNFLIGDSLINGTGVGQPLGILNAPSVLSVAKENGQPAASLQTENFTKMLARFYAPNYANAAWFHNQDVLPQLLTLTLGIGAAGVTTYMPPGGLSGSPYGTMLGRPMLPTEFNATLGTQGDVILADLGQMLSISKGSVAQAVSMHVQFLTDQLALRFILRLNARPWENAPITPFKGSNTQSSFLTLDARA